MPLIILIILVATFIRCGTGTDVDERKLLLRGSGLCERLMKKLFRNRVNADGLSIHYKHQFLKSNDYLYNIRIILYLADIYGRTEAEMSSVIIVIPETLEFLNADQMVTPAPRISAHFAVKYFGETIECMQPIKSYLLVSYFDDDQDLSGIEFFVTHLLPGRKLQIYVQFNLDSTEMVHALINMETPYSSGEPYADYQEAVGTEIEENPLTDYGNSSQLLGRSTNDKSHISPAVRKRATSYGSTVREDRHLEENIRPQELFEFARAIRLRRGRPPKKKSKIDDPVMEKFRSRKFRQLFLREGTSTRTAPKYLSNPVLGRHGNGIIIRKIQPINMLLPLKNVTHSRQNFRGVQTSYNLSGPVGSVATQEIVRDDIGRNNDSVADTNAPQVAAEFFIGVKLIYGRCRSTYSCFSFPKDCNFARNCFVTAAFTEMDNMVHVILSAVTTSWVAFGISEDDRMGDDAVFICKRTPGSRRVSIWQAYNLDDTEAYSVGTIVQEQQSDFKALTGSIYNGIITCDMFLPMKFKTESKKSFDLKNEPHHVMLAVGLRSVRSGVPGGISAHDFSIVSGNKAYIGRNETTILLPATQYAISTHEYLSTLTYGFFIPVGILFARYGQQSFHGSLCGWPKWLIVHMTLQGLSCLCNITSLLVIYIGRWGSAFATTSAAYHSVIGIFIFLSSLSSTGTGIAVFLLKRNGNQIPSALTWVHWGLGHFDHCFGAIELVRGPYLKKSFVACSYSVIAGYLCLYYLGANILLMFNTEHLRQKQGLDEAVIWSFLGPALKLKEETYCEQYRERKYIIICTAVALCISTACLVAEIVISVKGCDVGSIDYIV